MLLDYLDVIENCVKIGPASIKSLYVNTLEDLLPTDRRVNNVKICKYEKKNYVLYLFLITLPILKKRNGRGRQYPNLESFDFQSITLPPDHNFP
jgi:hypothetical protein